MKLADTGSIPVTATRRRGATGEHAWANLLGGVDMTWREAWETLVEWQTKLYLENGDRVPAANDLEAAKRFCVWSYRQGRAEHERIVVSVVGVAVVLESWDTDSVNTLRINGNGDVVDGIYHKGCWSTALVRWPNDSELDVNEWATIQWSE